MPCLCPLTFESEQTIILECRHTWVKGRGSEVAPHALHSPCSTRAIANFRWGRQCGALHMSSGLAGSAACACKRSRMFSKHSAASAMQPSRKRRWPQNGAAKALRTSSAGKARSRLNCSCENSSWNKERSVKDTYKCLLK